MTIINTENDDEVITRARRLDGITCEVCMKKANSVYQKDVIFGHEECLKGSLDYGLISRNIIEIRSFV